MLTEDYLGLSTPGAGGAKSLYDTLTVREREIFQLLAEGLKNQEIAERLHVSVKTVETHRAHIMEKLNLNNIAELVKYSIEIWHRPTGHLPAGQKGVLWVMGNGKKSEWWVVRPAFALRGFDAASMVGGEGTGFFPIRVGRCPSVHTIRPLRPIRPIARPRAA